MGLKELMDRATVIFPTPLAGKGFRELFHYLVNNIPGCRIDYTVERKGSVGIDPETEKSSMEEYPIRFSASINSITEDRLRIGSFEGVRDPFLAEHRSFGERFDLFYGIRFFTTPGYKEGEIAESELAMMDTVKQKTQEFFESRKESQE